MKKAIIFSLALFFAICNAIGQYYPKIDQLTKKIEPKVIQWRREIHKNPELSNREFKTAEKIAGHLLSLGIEVKTGVAKTGVVGILKGAKPGPVIALRADMDALPVTEKNELAFASTVKAMYNGQDVGVSHACGHDSHVAILMGVAEVLSQMKGELKGTVKFIFQPAEEGAPDGEEGGAELMVKEGVLESPKVDVIFGLHISSNLEIGKIGYRAGGFNAAVDEFKATIYGKQCHGAYPWQGVDPIVTSAQIINAWQTMVSRNMNITEAPAVFTVGAIHGGVRENIIPEKVEMIGTIRTFDTSMQHILHKKIVAYAENIAEAAGGSAKVDIEIMYPVTYNHVMLNNKMVTTLKKAAGDGNAIEIKAKTGAEDFAFFQQKVPGMFFNLGGRPSNVNENDAPSHHTPSFYIDESGFALGVKTMCYLVFDYGQSPLK
jgi:amidohydrolase